MPRRKQYSVVADRGNYKQWVYPKGTVTLMYNHTAKAWDVYHNGRLVKGNMKRRRVANLLAQRTASRASQ